METAVLPAQDHLAQQRYRHQSRVMSGMIYPFDLPRTRRKVKSPPQVFASAAVRTETERSSLNQNMRHTDSRSGILSPADATLGVIRNTPLSSSPSQFPISAGKASQYRLTETAPSEFIVHETSSILQKHRHTPSNTNSAPNGASSTPRQELRTKSEGELLQGVKKLAEAFSLQGGKKSTEVDRVLQRRRSGDKSLESTKDLLERKLVEKTHEKMAERSSDRRRNFDRKTLEKKTNVSSSSVADKNSTLPKKSAVITILQRPQTKEAAAENMAKFSGKNTCDVQSTKCSSVIQTKDAAVENVVKCSVRTTLDSQIMRPTPMSQCSPEKTDPTSVVPLENMRDAEGLPTDPDLVLTRSMTASPKLILKRRSNVQHLGKIGTLNTTDIVDADIIRVGEIGKPVLSPLEGFVLKERKLVDVRRDLSVSSPTSVEQVLVSEFSEESFTPVGGVVTTEVIRHEPSDSIAGEEEQIGADAHSRGRKGLSRSGSFREDDVSSDSSDDLMFSSSTPFKSCERWAGPAYTNSPPPSTLPFPTFPIQRLKSSLTEGTLAEVAMVRFPEPNSMSKSSSAPASPTRKNSLCFSSVSTMQSPLMDASSATKDLRRILNLNVDVALKDGLESINHLMADEANQATQSLKRILQLG